MRILKLWPLCTFLAVSAFSSVAVATTTCDGEEPQTCCESWINDISLDGKIIGALSQSTYEKLRSNLVTQKRIDKILCDYWKGHEECANVYEVPRCAGTVAGILKDLKDRVAAELSAEGKKRVIGAAIRSALAAAKSLEGRLGRIAKCVDKGIKSSAAGQVNPFVGIGSVLKEYGENLIDSDLRARGLANRLLLIHDDACGYGYGCASNASDTDALLNDIAMWETQSRNMARIPDVGGLDRKYAYLWISVRCEESGEFHEFYTPVFPMCGGGTRSQFKEKFEQTAHPNYAACNSVHDISFRIWLQESEEAANARINQVAIPSGYKPIPIPTEFLNTCGAD